jgi:RNA polymerase sigma factor (sigma-70 family)
LTEAQWDMVLSEVSTLRVCARRIARRVPARVTIDFDEFYDAGLQALIACAERYDPRIGAPYGAYARRRVLGAMMSLLRSRWLRMESLDAPRVEHDVPTRLADLLASTEGGTRGDLLRDAGPLPDELAERAIREQRVRAAIATLPAKQRWIVLSWSRGETLQAIGERHRRSTAWAHGEVRRALEALRERLAPSCEDGRRAA